MADIKTKNTTKDIKIFDKVSTVGDKVKSTCIRTKNNTENLTDDRYDSPTEFAESNIRGVVEGATQDTAKGLSDTSKSAYKKGRELYKSHKDVKQAKRSVDNAKQTVKTANKAQKTTGKQTTKTLKHSVKTTKKSVKTAKKTAKTTVKTSKTTVKTAKEAAKASARAAKAAARAAKVAMRMAIITAKMVAKVTAAAIKAIIAGIKALVAAIAAGGWVAVVIIVIICLVGMLFSYFGIFFSGEDTGTGITMQTAVAEINAEYQSKIEEIKKANTYNAVEITGLNPSWKDVLAVYAAKTSFDPNNPQEVTSMDENKKTLLKTVFWDMHTISSATAIKSVSVPTETADANGNIIVTYKNISKIYLYIAITHKTPNEMETTYRFNAQQKQILSELLSDEFTDLWSSVLYGISGGSKKIISVASTQIGNSDGQPYWSWYGFGSRVEWCACFISWCANESGYIESGIIPKFASCDVGMSWFKNHNQWQEKTYVPKPGDIVFFDWDNNNSADHVGIVEKSETNKIHIIEGNSGDACKQLEYATNDNRILGFGIPQY